MGNSMLLRNLGYSLGGLLAAVLSGLLGLGALLVYVVGSIALACAHSPWTLVAIVLGGLLLGWVWDHVDA